MDDVERTIARAAIDAPPAENTTQLAANIANAIHGDSMTTELILASLCSRQILIKRSAPAGNLAAGEASTSVKLYYEKGPEWREHMASRSR